MIIQQEHLFLLGNSDALSWVYKIKSQTQSHNVVNYTQIRKYSVKKALKLSISSLKFKDMHPVRRRETYYIKEFRCSISGFYKGNEFIVQCWKLL